MIRTKKFENLPQITTISPSGKIVITENGVDKVISFEDFSNLPPSPEVWNNPSTTFTASEVNVTDIQSAADSKLLDLKINTVSKFVVRKDGNLGIGVTNPAARLDISDTVLAGSGSLAGSILNLAQTWNTTGNPTAIKLNVTNTASGAASNLLDLQVGGSSKFKVAKDGQTYGGISSDSDNGYYRTVKAIKHFQGYFAGVTNGALGGCGAAWVISGTGDLAWSDSSQATSCADLRLSRDGANTFAQRNGVNPQAFRLYNTYTSSTNFERLNLRWDVNVLKIGTEKGNAGGTARAMEFQTDGTTRITLPATGGISLPNGSDISFGGAFNFYGTTSSTTINGPTAFGQVGVSINGSDKWIFKYDGLLCGGGTTSSFPALKRNGSGIQIRLADDSANTTLEAGNIYATGNLGIGTTAPAAKLHIVGPNYLTSIIDAPLYPALHIYSNGVSIGYIGSGNISGAAATDLGIQAPSGSKLFLAAGNTTAALTVNSGYVGIGTTNPSTALHVNSGNTAVARFSGPTSPIAAFSINDNYFGTFGSAGGSLTGGTVTDLAFQTSNNLVFATGGTALSNIRMFVASTGNVGIGLTNPQAKLDVSYSHGIDGGFIYGIKSIVNGGSNNTNIAAYFSATNGSNQIALRTGTGKIDFNGELTTSGNIFLGAIPSATKGNLQIGDATSSFAAGGGGLLTFSGDTQAQGDPARSIFAFVRGIKENSSYQNSLGALIFGTQSSSAVTGLLSTVSEKMRISSAGNLGLGTTTPLAKLDIVETWNSNISVTGASGTGSVATITFATQSTVIPVGATVVVSSVNPSGYNGTFVVTASTVTSISYTNSTTATYVSGGAVQQLFTAIKTNITDTASATASKLLDLQVGSSSILTVDKAGNITVPNLASIRPSGIYPYAGILLGGGSSFNQASFALQWVNSGAVSLSSGRFSAGNSWLALNNNAVFGWGNASDLSTNSPALDTILLRDGSNILGMRNGVNPQAFRLYGTYTDASNYARLAISCDTSGNAILATEGLGTGAAGTISIGNANKIILGTSAGVDLAFRATDSTSVGFRIGSGNTLEIVRSDAGAYANIIANNITTQGNLSTLYAPINSNVNVAGTTGEHVALIASSSSNGTAANGFGTRIVLRTESSTTAARDSGAISSLWSDATDATRTSDLLFYNALNGTLTERVRILGSNGNLGIGRATPLAKLDVNGTAFINTTGDGGTGAMLTVGGTGTTIYTPGAVWATGGLVLTGDNRVTTVGVNGGNIVNVSGLQIANGGPVLSYVSSTGIKVLQANGTTYGSVNAGTLALGSSYAGVAAPTNGAIIEGNLGIGTTTPTSKLHIAGPLGSNTSTYDSEAALRLTNTTGDSSWILTSGIIGVLNANFCIRYSGNATPAFVISNQVGYSNNVGIQVNNPTARLDIADTTLAGSGSLAGSILNLAQTWNTTGAPTAIKLNVTNTGSGADSNLLDLQVGGASKFSVNKNGVAQFSGGSFRAVLFDANGGIGVNRADVSMTQPLVFLGYNTAPRITIVSGGTIGWSPSQNDASGGNATPDTILLRDGAANILGLRNGVNPQTFRLYNTYTDATTFERLNIKWDTNVLKIGTEKGASGGTARAMEFQTDGVTRLSFSADNIIAHISSTNLITGTQIRVGGQTRITNTSDGVLQISDSSQAGLNRIQLGGTTSSFPALKRNGAALQIRLADDSANAALETAGLTVVGSASVSGHFSAATKSFLIDHPTKEGKKLQYGVVESNQHSVLVRGKTAENIIELPEEWAGLVHEDSVTVQLTPIGSYQQLFVISQDNQRVVVGGSTGQYNYTIYGERKDVDKLITEI